jgi:hypothetical protein
MQSLRCKIVKSLRVGLIVLITEYEICYWMLKVLLDLVSIASL